MDSGLALRAPRNDGEVPTLLLHGNKKAGVAAGFFALSIRHSLVLNAA